MIRAVWKASLWQLLHARRDLLERLAGQLGALVDLGRDVTSIHEEGGAPAGAPAFRLFRALRIELEERTEDALEGSVEALDRIAAALEHANALDEHRGVLCGMCLERRPVGKSRDYYVVSTRIGAAGDLLARRAAR